MMKRRINSPQSTTALAALPQPSIRDIAAEDFPPNVHALWREAGSILETAGVVDSRHLVLVFSVDYASLTATRNVPREVLKYTDNEEHAPYKAECLKMAPFVTTVANIKISRARGIQWKEKSGSFPPLRNIARDMACAILLKATITLRRMSHMEQKTRISSTAHREPNIANLGTGNGEWDQSSGMFRSYRYCWEQNSPGNSIRGDTRL